jgi:hypothetical protein
LIIEGTIQDIIRQGRSTVIINFEEDPGITLEGRKAIECEFGNISPIDGTIILRILDPPQRRALLAP